MQVTIVNKWVSHYRLPFYEALKSKLELRDIKLVLIYGEPTDLADRRKNDWVDVPWGEKVLNIGVGPGGKLLWQPVLVHLHSADLIIVEHANKLLLNYLLQALRPFTKKKLAFWGHGRNYQSSNTWVSGLKEKWKKSLMLHVDWWFTYNKLCVSEIDNKGFPADKITNVENAVDTAEIKRFGADISARDLFEFKQKIQIEGRNVAVFCGGMFGEKRLPFLLESVIEVKKSISDFEVLFIGAGIDQPFVEEAANKYSWIKYLGPLFGKEKVLAMKAAQIYLMPGLIGLGALDAFALGLPVITTAYKYHSPELYYVRDGVNGIISNDNVNSFSLDVSRILMDQQLMKKLINGCHDYSNAHTIENMASNFGNGIIDCLNYHN